MTSVSRRDVVAVDGVIEAQENPNQMEVERFNQLVSNIKRFGFLQPILVRQGEAEGTFQVCDGHHRLRAAKVLGMAEVPVEVITADVAQANALQVSMNRLRGELELSATARILDELQKGGWSFEQMGDLGFTSEELEDLISAIQPAQEILPESISPEVSEVEEKEGPFILEVEFSTEDELRRAKRALRHFAGKGGTIAQGLLKLLDDK